MAIVILDQAVFDKPSGGTGSYTHGLFPVPGGTSALLVQVEYRGYSSGAAPAVTSVTHNGDALTSGSGSATPGGFDNINTWWGYLRDPDVGTFDIIVTFPSDVRGVKLWMLAITGEKSSGNVFGGSAYQRTAGAATNSVGLGLTPDSTGASMLLASLSIAAETTLTTWTGAGFTSVATGTYTGNDGLTGTSRYLLNAPGGAASTIAAVFGASTKNIGGSLVEILADPTGTDVSDTFGVTVAVAGAVSNGSSATLEDAAFRRLQSWTEAFSFQPDAAGSDCRILAAGPEAAPNLAIDQIADYYRWSYRLTDGVVVVQSTPGTQSVAAQHVALVHGGEDGPALYLNGTPSGGAVAGGALTGVTDIGVGGETIGSHPAPVMAPYTGLIGRYLLYEGVLSAAQIALLALSEKDPGALWGYGAEDDAQSSNQAVVACPMRVALDGQPEVTLSPVILDPAGGEVEITSVTQPTNGTLVISESLQLVYTPTPGWLGSDSATYTASDGLTQSTGKILITQIQPSIKAVGDSITVATNGSVTFDPRINDVGAGNLSVVSVTTPTIGTATRNANGTITYQNSSAGSSDSFSYTVRDNYGQATASVAVTVTGSSFISASDDSKSTLAGTPVEIDVLLNDTASSDYLPIVVKPGSLTTPSPSGTATLQPNGKVLYTPASGFTGQASFQYTIKPSALATPTATATARVQVNSTSSSWWKQLAYRSDNPDGWAQGYSYFDAAWDLYQKQVSWPDGFGGGHFGGDKVRVATWTRVFGGDPSKPNTIDSTSQLAWIGNTGSFCSPFNNLPVNTAWCCWVFNCIPLEDKTERADHGAPVWNKIIDGDYDDGWKAMGVRIAKNFATRGISLNWFIGRMNHEMQQSNPYRIYEDTKLLYKAAAEQIYAKIREGAQWPLRFAHTPSKDRTYRTAAEKKAGIPAQDFGTLESWCPNNADLISASYHPEASVQNQTGLDRFNAGHAAVYGLMTDMADLAAAKGWPMALLEWSPRWETCGCADLVYETLYPWLKANAANIVTELVYDQTTFSTSAADGSAKQTAAGKAAWARGVASYKTLWGASRKKPT